MSLSPGYKQHLWKWWCEDDSETEDGDAREVLAPGTGGESEAISFAENLVRKNFSAWDYPESTTIDIRTPAGERFTIEVEVRPEPEFYGHVAKRAE